MIKINSSVYSSVFVIPSAVADDHIRLAGAVQLKVILFIFRHASDNITPDDISSALGIPRADISDALAYWAQAGFIEYGEQPNAAPAPAETKAQPAEIPPISKATQTVTAPAPQPSAERVMPPAVRPTHDEIAARVAESPEVRNLFFEAQRIFGRTIGYDTQSSLLYLMDHEGLPAEVIVMICGYAEANGKRSTRYIEKIGEDWAQREIDTFDKATNRIAELENVNVVWNELKNLIGLDTPKPTARQSEYISKWSCDYGFSTEMIYLAYERMTEKTGKINFKYMDKILSSWHTEGIKTKADVDESDARFREKNASAKKKTTSAPQDGKSAASYDINKAFGSYDVPTKTKKGQ